MKPVATISAPGAEQFHTTIRPAGQPVLMKGLVAHWPIVRAAMAGDVPLAEAMAANASTEAVVVSHAEPHIRGKFHYADGGTALNFERSEMELARFLALLLRERDRESPRAFAVQGHLAARILPHFQSSHPLPLLPPAIEPRLWIGNAAQVAIHGDDLENIACLAAGKRRFVLFPPEAIGDLYLGPFELTPGGTPISMVDFAEPDLARYPRFAHALEQAQVAEMEPGDALYVPYQWYHGVAALAPFNVLVNYWWNPARADLGSPWDALLHGLIALAQLPDDQRRAWRAMFEHYVFRPDGNPAAHLDEAVRGVIGRLTPEAVAQLQVDLRANLDPASAAKVGPLR